MRKLSQILVGAALFIFGTATLFAQVSQQPQYMYVCNQGSATITVIDTSTNEIAGAVDLKDLGFSANAKPHHAVAEKNGSYWYVTLIGENRVLKFDRNNELLASVELEVPGLMAMHPSKDILYVGRSMSAVNPPQSFGVVNRTDMEVMDEVGLFFTRPHAIASTPEGDWMYIGSLSENQIYTTNIDTEESDLVNIPGQTHIFVNFAITPDGKTMIATGQVSGQLLFFDIADPVTPKLTGNISVGAQPWHPVISADGTYAYFANKQDHSVSVVDLGKREVVTTIKGEGLAQPHGAALSDDGKYLYITNNNLDGTYNPEGRDDIENLPGTVVIIDTETNQIIKVIEVGRYPSGIGTNIR